MSPSGGSFTQIRITIRMKVEINVNGLLSLTAETPTEAYALRKWWKDFQQGDYTSILSINPNLNSPKEDTDPNFR